MNDSYTEFTITFNNAKATVPNGKQLHSVSSIITAPADGTKVQNNAEITADDQVLPVSDDRTRGYKVIGVTSGGTIRCAKNCYRIMLYKVDENHLTVLQELNLKSPSRGCNDSTRRIVTTDASV